MKSIIGIILIIASVALFWGFTKPAWEEALRLRKEKTSFDQALLNAENLSKELARLLKEYNQIPADDVLKLGVFIPEVQDAGNLVVELESLSKTHGVILKKVDINSKTEGARNISGEKAFGEIPFSFSISGSYDKAASFIRDLEKSLRVIDITKMSFSSESADSYEFNIDAKAYWRPKSEE